MSPPGSRNSPPDPVPAAGASGWADVAAESAAIEKAGRPVEPRPGDLIAHPVLGTLEVIEADDARIEVRDRERRRRKLARAVLDLRLDGERKGKRLLRASVR